MIPNKKHEKKERKKERMQVFTLGKALNKAHPWLHLEPGLISVNLVVSSPFPSSM
jgi:hypothetical protein